MVIVEIGELGHFVDTNDCYDTPAEVAGVLCYKPNNTVVKETCPECGNCFKPQPEVWPFLTKTGQPVCEECANRIEATFRNTGNDALGHICEHECVACVGCQMTSLQTQVS